jgi:predicted exporter
MGIWISAGLFALLHWSLELLRIGGAALCLCGAALFVRHFAAVRRRQVRHGLRKTVPWGAYVSGGIGLSVLGLTSLALSLGESLGAFPA